MTKRESLEAKIRENSNKIEELKDINVELQREALLLCDEKQWFTEKTEIHGKGKNKEELLIGRMHWNEFLKDESYPKDKTKGVWVERACVVRVNGEWL